MKALKQNCNRTIIHLRAILFFLLFAGGVGFVCAQNGSISGIVSDSETREPIIGAVVAIEGTQTAIMTDVDGDYTIPKLKAGTYTLVVTYVGYEKETRKVTLAEGEKKNTDFLLNSRTTLSEVIVTALGIEREEKALGYAVSKIGGEDLTNTVSSNWLNGMSGKVAGLNFDQSSAGPGGSIRVTLRGEGSLSHNKNTALFVIDGVPINSDMTSNTGGGGYSNTDATIDYGNGASDLNPDDIESVSVLKGPAATALYGSRAANGAIIITTKSGRKTKGIGVSINSSVTFERAGFWPDFQEEYGAGNYTGATMTPNPFSNWTVDDPYSNRIVTRSWSRYQFGAKYDGSPVYTYGSRNWTPHPAAAPVPEGSVLGADGHLYTPQPYENQDWYKGFFETGVTFNNSVSIDANNGKDGSLRLSIKDTRNSWIIPNTGYNSQNISVSANQKANEYISLSAKVTYYRKNSDNLPMSGYSTNSPLYALIWSPAQTSVKDYKTEYDNDRINHIYESGLSKTYMVNQYNDNPYFMVNEQLNSMSRDRVYGNATIDLTFIPKKLTMMLRAGMDLSNDFRTQRKPYYSVSALTGFYREQTIKTFESNVDFLLSYKDRFNDFDVNASFGGNSMYFNGQNVVLTAEKLLEKNIFNLNNVDGGIIYSPVRNKKAINSFYGFASIGWRSMVYLELTGRNDWSSTLPASNRSYFYPSVNTTFLLDEMFDFKKNAPWINLLKLRGSWANVGNDTDAYQLINTYNSSDFSGGYYLNATIKNPNLKPENVESWEFGLETRMFNDQFGLDVAYYNSATTDQIINIPTDWSEGASSRMINAGKVTNKGVEIGLRVTPVRTKDWNWNINVNWSKNWNKLVELAPDVELWQLNSSNTIGSRVFVYAYPGQELGRIYGAGYQKAPQGAYYMDESGNKIDCSGQTIVNNISGNPILDTELQDLGSIYPNWKGGINQTISYKNLSMSMSFAFQSGGRAYSVTNFALSYMGKLTNSLEGRYDGLIHEGVNLNADGTYSKNSTITTNIVDYYSTFVLARNNVENNVFSTSYFKMKELRLDYRFPAKILKGIGVGHVIQDMSFGAYATNLFCITDWPQYDPDVASFSGGSLNRGVETGGYPMTRTYGINLRLSF